MNSGRFQKGHIISAEVKKKISDTLKRGGIKPKIHFVWKGKTSDSHKQKLKEFFTKKLKDFPHPVISCRICFNDFTVTPARKNTAKYCSIKCQHKSLTRSREHKVQIKNINREMRRARELNAVGIFTKDEWVKLKEKYNYFCPACGEQEPGIKLQMDHIVPLSKGGRNDISNIQPLCRICNIRKLDKTIKYEIPLKVVPSIKIKELL